MTDVAHRLPVSLVRSLNATASNANSAGLDVYGAVISPVVSIGSGSEPVSSRDGRRIFYRGGGQIMAATVRGASAFEVLRRESLMPDTYTKATNPHANFDVTPDGKALVLLQPVSNGAMVVVSNWKSILHSRMAGADTR